MFNPARPRAAGKVPRHHLLPLLGALCGAPGAVLPLTSHGAAEVAIPQAILSADEGSDLAEIPGTGGIRISSFSSAELQLSAGAQRWAVNVNAADQPRENDSFVIIGDRDGALAAFGEPSTTESLGFPLSRGINTPFGVTDAGDVAFSGNLGGGAPFDQEEIVARFDAATGQFTLIAREGDPIPGIEGERFGGTLDAVSVLGDGRVAFRDGGTQGGLPGNQDEFFFISGDPVTALVQSGVSAPQGQAGGTEAVVRDILGDSSASADGLRYLAEVDLDLPGTAARAIIVDDAVVLQGGQPVGALPGGLDLIGDARMHAGGHWSVRGTTDEGAGFLVVDGALLLATGEALPQGLPGETVHRIQDVDISARGDVAVLVDTVVGIEALRLLVLVFPVDGEPLLALVRGASGVPDQGTAIDVDGDGVADDAYFFSPTIGTLALGETGELYIVTRALDAASQTVGDYLIRLDLLAADEPCNVADLANPFGRIDAADVDAFRVLYTSQDPSVDFNGDGQVDRRDARVFVVLLRRGCPERADL